MFSLLDVPPAAWKFGIISSSVWKCYLPVVEHRQSEGLSLSVCAQVCLEPEGVDGWDESLDGVEWRPWNRCILGDVTPGGWETLN